MNEERRAGGADGKRDIPNLAAEWSLPNDAIEG